MENSVNVIVGTSLLIFILAFSIYIFFANLTSVGLSGIMFSSPFPINVPGPEIATTFAIFNVVGRFVFYASISIPSCARCAGIKTVSKLSGRSATKAKFGPRLSTIQRAENASNNAADAKKQLEMRQQKKKNKDGNDNGGSVNQVGILNPLQQQQQPQQLLLTCPPHVKPGQFIKVRVQNGREVSVQIPQGIRPGMNFYVQCPP